MAQLQRSSAMHLNQREVRLLQRHYFLFGQALNIFDQMASKEELIPDYEYELDENHEEEKTNGANGNKVTAYSGVHSAGFKDLLLKPQLQRAIIECGFEHPSEVQQECIPQAMIGVDVLCQAKSGMGKTAVFVLTILHQLPEDPKPISALILCHTRELAYQIKQEFTRFTQFLPEIRTEVIFGGQPIKDQVNMLKGLKPPHIVVGTPGRIKHLVKEKALDLSGLKIFVLDECDRMLEETDMRSDVQQIFMATPHQKQVMMFSATFPNECKNIARKFMKNPFEIFIDNQNKMILHGLKQYYIKLEDNQKIKKLTDLLDSLMFNQVIIFVQSIKHATKLDEILRRDNFPSICIHGDLPQEERIKRYQDFKKFNHRIIVATDIFGRGIDIERINVVFNFDMPDSSDQYLHRVCRAGRFGTKGLSISFISSPTEQETLDAIQKRFEVKIEELPTTIDVSTYMNN
ncbi:atp-dependent rna helicase uap56 [Stylonychia lemnae]|uniref:RNA helicase n=1 Tax=Stylonychia lemnae TaxID=5949 RepID=A0A078A0R9_STYLE|nr:atp-dependent rna helicase uap56 [Stylonychia lemnae]|eukprot:CDW75053.1 atp-dependent rna helicase uap56 [Stylonychia lemnae]